MRILYNTTRSGRMLMLFSCLLLAFHCRAQQHTETRSLPAFQELHLNGNQLLILEKGRTNSLKITGSDTSDFSHVRSEVSHGVLHIWSAQNSLFKKHRRLRVYVTATSLERLNLTGSGMIESRSPWSAAAFFIHLNGSGQIRFEGHADLIQAELEGSGRMQLQTSCKQLHARLMGSGNLTLSGTSGNASLQVEGSGLIDARNLKAAHETRRVLGSGMIQK